MQTRCKSSAGGHRGKERKEEDRGDEHGSSGAGPTFSLSLPFAGYNWGGLVG